MSDRTALLTRVYSIAKKLSIDRTLVDRIIKAYLQSCRDELVEGHTVDLCGIATLIPDVLINNYRTTIAYRCKVLSLEYGIPYYTVLQVVKEYLDTVKEDIYNARPANIYGLCTISPLSEGGIVTKVYSSISANLQEYLAMNGSHARICTNREFKNKVKEAEIRV